MKKKNCDPDASERPQQKPSNNSGGSDFADSNALPTLLSSYDLCPLRGARATDPCLRATVLGQTLAMPVILGPSSGRYPAASATAALAAGAAGIGYIIPAISCHSIESMPISMGSPQYFELHLSGGRNVGEGTIHRALSAGFKGLFLSIASPASGFGTRDGRYTSAAVPADKPFSPLTIYQPAIGPGPRWFANQHQRSNPDFSMKVRPLDGVGLKTPGPSASASEPPGVTWSDVKWIREIWKGPIAIRGISTAEDARRAVDFGADAIVASNLDQHYANRMPFALEAFPEIVGAVNGQAVILMDGQLRLATDVVKAIALGAQGVILERRNIGGGKTAGKEDILHAIDTLKSGMIRTLKTLGCKSVSELGPRHIQKR